MPRIEVPLSAEGITFDLDDGGRIRMRPIRADDGEALRDGFARLSPESRFARFFTHVHELSDDWVRRLTDVDHVSHRAWVAFDPDDDPDGLAGRGVGVARLVELADDPSAAELAIVVADDDHRRGIGSIMLRVAVGTAAVSGYSTLVAHVLNGNAAMRELVRGLGGAVRSRLEGEAVRYEIPLALSSDTSPDAVIDDEWLIDGALYDLLRLAAEGAAEPDEVPHC